MDDDRVILTKRLRMRTGGRKAHKRIAFTFRQFSNLCSYLWVDDRIRARWRRSMNKHPSWFDIKES